MRPTDLIARKRDGCEHTPEELQALVRALVDGSMPDYQTAAWLMAAYLRGLSPAETLSLCAAMRDSGRTIDLSSIPGVKVDKHSSGGVGDKTSLVVVPILAAAGCPILKMSGRGLGFSGGTIDKLEAIPGFRTDLPAEAAVEQVRRIGAAIVGQTADLAPADKKLYALRDVTATIDSIPLIAASIMSKKLAGGADAVLLDVKVGRGAFMKTLERARELARAMVDIGVGAGVKTVAALTAMDEPLGYAVGNAVEVAEAGATLTGRGRVDERFRDLCVTLSARALVLGGKAADDEGGRRLAEEALHSGAAAAKLEEVIAAQGGDHRVVQEPDRLPRAPAIRRVRSETEGYVHAIDAEAVGRLAVALGAGRQRKEDSIDPAVGIVLMKKRGDHVEAGEILADLHLRDEQSAPDGADTLRAAYSLAPDQPRPEPIIYEFVE